MSISSMLRAISLDHAYHLGFQDKTSQTVLSTSTVSATCPTLTKIQNLNVRPNNTVIPPPACQTESSSQKRTLISGSNLVSNSRPETSLELNTHNMTDCIQTPTPNISSAPESVDAQDSFSLSSTTQLFQDPPEQRPSNKRMIGQRPNYINKAMGINRKIQPIPHIRCCEKVFSKSLDLKKHLALHHGKKSLIVMRKIEQIGRVKKCSTVAKRIGPKKSNLNYKVLQSSSKGTKSPETTIQNNNHDHQVPVVTASSIWQNMFNTEVLTESSGMSSQRSSGTNDSQSIRSQSVSLNKVRLLETKKSKKQRLKCNCPNCTINANNKIKDSKGNTLHVCNVCGNVYSLIGSLRQHMLAHEKQKTTVNMDRTVKRVAPENVNAENQISKSSNLAKSPNSSNINVQNNNTPMRIITASSMWETMFATNN